jgi:hypothetical protein
VNGSCWSDSSSIECRQKFPQIHDCFLSSAVVWRDTKAQGTKECKLSERFSGIGLKREIVA